LLVNTLAQGLTVACAGELVDVMKPFSALAIGFASRILLTLIFLGGEPGSETNTSEAAGDSWSTFILCALNAASTF
jgi:hypothetical protein